MAVPKVVGYPDYTTDGTNKNIPVLFEGKTLEKFYASTVLNQITTTDYIGKLTQQGDRVIIRTVPNITIRPYAKGQKLVLEYPESPSIEFQINRAQSYNFALDDIDVKQMDIAMMTKYADDAAQQLKITVETEFFANIYPDADTYNKGNTAGKISGNLVFGTAGTPLQLTTNNILTKLVEMGQSLDEQNIPETDRWCIIPAWMSSMILTSDLKNVSLTGDPTTPLRTGLLGRIGKFTLYNSNLLPRVVDSGGQTCTYIPFGHKNSCVFISQLTKTETYRPQDTFSNAMKGLMVYDFDVIQPTAFGVLYAYK